MKINIAIDGPAASGKSAAADLLAKRINYVFVDTGIIYRSFTLFCLKKQIDLSNKLLLINNVKTFEIAWKQNSFYFNNEIMTDEIYSDFVSNNVPAVAQIKEIRAIFNDKIRAVTKNKGFIVVGRDITSVVLPDAEIKIFLTSSIKTRIDRRYHQYTSQNIATNYQTLAQEMASRDLSDQQRDVGHLQIVNDAIVIDNSNDSLIATVEKLYQFFQQFIITNSKETKQYD